MSTVRSQSHGPNTVNSPQCLQPGLPASKTDSCRAPSEHLRGSRQGPQLPKPRFLCYSTAHSWRQQQLELPLVNPTLSLEDHREGRGVQGIHKYDLATRSFSQNQRFGKGAEQTDGAGNTNYGLLHALHAEGSRF